MPGCSEPRHVPCPFGQVNADGEGDGDGRVGLALAERSDGLAPIDGGR
jgi:hypothetical protein